MDITKDMRTLSGMKSMDEASKNIFLKKFGRELVQIEQRRNALLPEHDIFAEDDGARADDPTRSSERGGVGLGGQSIATRRTSQRQQRIQVYDWVLLQLNQL